MVCSVLVVCKNAVWLTGERQAVGMQCMVYAVQAVHGCGRGDGMVAGVCVQNMCSAGEKIERVHRQQRVGGGREKRPGT